MAGTGKKGAVPADQQDPQPPADASRMDRFIWQEGDIDPKDIIRAPQKGKSQLRIGGSKVGSKPPAKK